MFRLVDEGPANEFPERIMLRVAPGCWQALRLRDVTYVKARHYESRFFTLGGESYRSHLSLAELYPRLEPYGFRRCHRSHLVNLENIAQVVRRGSCDNTIILKGKEPARIPLQRHMMGIQQDFLWLR